MSNITADWTEEQKAEYRHLWYQLIRLSGGVPDDLPDDMMDVACDLMLLGQDQINVIKTRRKWLDYVYTGARWKKRLA